jgi:hypothetical protein
MWWHMSVTPALGRQINEDLEFEGRHYKTLFPKNKKA